MSPHLQRSATLPAPPPCTGVGKAETARIALARLGLWLRDHQAGIRTVQWVIVLVYAVLILVPVFTPLPDELAHPWSNLALFAQFAFWGLWWPFVLLSMVLFGRLWCGVLCPEGTLSEWASRHGQGHSIPRWMRWGGWPLVAFVGTTMYGQMISVYQYPKAVLLILGGSTLAAMVIGFRYGRNQRIWCKYLCPVNGVFNLLARLAPLHFRVDEAAWRASYPIRLTSPAAVGAQASSSDTTPAPLPVIPVHCAPLVPLRTMRGAAACHMCGRCAGHRGAIALHARPPNREIVQHGAVQHSRWESMLLLYGLLGVALGAFHWTASPFFITLKQQISTWLIDHNTLWPLETNTPWWLFTHYPERGDVFSWLDGALVIFYILAVGILIGSVLATLCALTIRVLSPEERAPQADPPPPTAAHSASAITPAGVRGLLRTPVHRTAFHHLVQALIPLAGAGLFVGLSATTVTLLRNEYWPTHWANPARAVLLSLATLWSLWLAWRIGCQYNAAPPRRLAALALFTLTLASINGFWWLTFHKS